MGEEIYSNRFSKEDYEVYKKNLKEETQLLKSWFEEKKFSKATPNIGLELEGWLINDKGEPVSQAMEFLKIADRKNIVPELALFNFEINAPHHPLTPSLINLFEKDLNEYWKLCQESAKKISCSPLMIGSLPTLDNSKLTMDYITPFNRYYALNEQIMKFRDHKPIQINISGDEILKSDYDCILFESSATSLQIHLEIDQDEAVDYYNASILASPFMVALCANSAFLCGKSLWSETRIPVFEQTVTFEADKNPCAKKRVTLGNHYLKKSFFELFEENENLYSPLIPSTFEEPKEKMKHVCFHNGTVWRWNRPIIGFNEDGSPHLRIEHRVLSAGPSIKDTLANITLFLGLVHAFKKAAPLLTKQISFENNYINLYAASKKGLEASFVWRDGKEKSLKEVYLTELHPLIKKSLQELSFTDENIHAFLDEIITNRVKTGINGASWQKEFVKRNGKDYKNLVLNYHKNQNSGLPVHNWPL